MQSESIINMRINFFEEVAKFYPQVFRSAVSSLKDKQKRNIEESICIGQSQALFRDNISVELITFIILQLMDSIYKNNAYLRNEYSRNQIFQSAIITYLRGLSTDKGMKIIDNYINTHKI